MTPEQIINELRNAANDVHWAQSNLCDDAADLISTLSQENARLKEERLVLRDLLSMTFDCWKDYQAIKYEMHSGDESKTAKSYAMRMPASEGALLDACVKVLGLGGWRGSVRPEIDYPTASPRIAQYIAALSSTDVLPVDLVDGNSDGVATSQEAIENEQ